MEFLLWIGAALGLIAFVRVEKLTRTLKGKGILEADYRED